MDYSFFVIHEMLLDKEFAWVFKKKPKWSDTSWIISNVYNFNCNFNLKLQSNFWNHNNVYNRFFDLFYIDLTDFLIKKKVGMGLATFFYYLEPLSEVWQTTLMNSFCYKNKYYKFLYRVDLDWTAHLWHEKAWKTKHYKSACLLLKLYTYSLKPFFHLNLFNKPNNSRTALENHQFYYFYKKQNQFYYFYKNTLPFYFYNNSFKAFNLKDFFFIAFKNGNNTTPTPLKQIKVNFKQRSNLTYLYNLKLFYFNNKKLSILFDQNFLNFFFWSKNKQSLQHYFGLPSQKQKKIYTFFCKVGKLQTNAFYTNSQIMAAFSNFMFFSNFRYHLLHKNLHCNIYSNFTNIKTKFSKKSIFLNNLISLDYYVFGNSINTSTLFNLKNKIKKIDYFMQVYFNNNFKFTNQVRPKFKTWNLKDKVNNNIYKPINFFESSWTLENKKHRPKFLCKFLENLKQIKNYKKFEFEPHYQLEHLKFNFCFLFFLPLNCIFFLNF